MNKKFEKHNKLCCLCSNCNLLKILKNDSSCILEFDRRDYSTLIITDQRCLKHAGFPNYANVIDRVSQKNQQPENAERLMVLIDSKTGVLTQANEFSQN